MIDLVHRVLVPERLALIFRHGETLGYNPAFNLWEHVDAATAEVLRWLRAGRERHGLEEHLGRRFGHDADAARERLQQIVKWCIFRRLLYLDRAPHVPAQVPPPNPLVTVYWICTQACNLRCTYCYQEATVARPHELSTVEAIDLIDQVVEAGVRTLVFTGGEPFMRRDVLELARYAKGRGIRTTVITNGHFITRRNVGEMAAAFDLVTISLDHMIPEHHDVHRGEGSWRHALGAIDVLLDAGVPVDVNSTLSSDGLKHLKELLSIRRTRRIGMHKIVPQFPMGRGAGHREDELTTTELLQLSDRLHATQRDIDDAPAAALKPEGSYSTKGKRRFHCGAGLSEVSVDPEGWVYPCKLLQYPEFRTSNVRTRRLSDIFANEPILRVTQGRVVDTLQPCNTCIIKSHCGGGCRGIHYSFSGQYTQADPLFCAYLRRSFEAQAWNSTGQTPAGRAAHFDDTGRAYVHEQFIPLASVGRAQ